MNLHEITARLAFQVDRKILELEEENYFRMDLSAHEYSGAARIRKEKKERKPFPLAEVKRFVLTSVLIFALLFTITNAAAYSKIIMASITDYIQENQPEPTSLALITTDPFTGEKIAEYIAEEQTLEALESAALIPENGILPLDIRPTSYENRLVIPSLKINSRIVEPALGIEALVSNDWNELEDQIRSSLIQGVVHYPGTADPGKKGNAFLTGHSSNVFWEPSKYNTVFALLPKIEVDADIYVTYEQKEYHYVVESIEEVQPDNVDVLAQGDDYTLTLMTCTPVGTTLKRLVVKAKLVE